MDATSQIKLYHDSKYTTTAEIVIAGPFSVKNFESYYHQLELDQCCACRVSPPPPSFCESPSFLLLKEPGT